MGWGPVPGKGGQKFQNIPSLWRRLQKPTSQAKNFFSISTRRIAESVGGLNSSLALAAGKLQDCKALQKKWRTRDLKDQDTLFTTQFHAIHLSLVTVTHTHTWIVVLKRESLGSQSRKLFQAGIGEKKLRGWKNFKFLLFVYSTLKKLHHQVGLDGRVHSTQGHAALTAVTDIKKESVWFVIVYCFCTAGSVKFLRLSFLWFFWGRNWQCLGLQVGNGKKTLRTTALEV